MTSSTPPYSDLGQWIAEQAIVAVDDAIGEADLDKPGSEFVTHGSGVPIQDVCDGILWARVATVFPTNGDSQPFNQARIGWEFPAWSFSIDVGILFCRTVIDGEEGAAVSDDYEQEIAVRDSAYRMALFDGLAYRLPPIIRDVALGQRLSLWTPIGPEGGTSGGLVNVTVVAASLCVPSC